MRLDLAARKYLGVPFIHQGRNPAFGIDCIGLLVLAARDCGLPVTDSNAYAKDPAFNVLESHLQARFGSPLPVSAIQPGDIAAINFKGATRHVGLVSDHKDGLSLIHTNMSEGRVTEARIDAKWLRRIKAIYRPEAIA